MKSHECVQEFEAVTACPCCRTVDLHWLMHRTPVPMGEKKRATRAVLEDLPPATFRAFDSEPSPHLRTRQEDGFALEVCVHVRRVCRDCHMNWFQACGWRATEWVR